jgi:hypothetical protein
VLAALAALAALAPWTVATAAAQDLDLYGPPTAENCARWAAMHSEGRAPALAVLRQNPLASCPDAGPAALAAAVQRASAETDTTYLAWLAGRAGLLTHPAVFAAALRLAGDRGATVESRAAGLLVLGGQNGAGGEINGTGWGALLVEPVPNAARGCFMSLRPICGGPAPASAPLPGDAKRQAAVVVDRIRTDPAEPALLRTLARCVRPAVARGVPPQVDVSGVRLRYLCGNWFRIHNPTVETLMFGFAAEKTGERSNISVFPGGERMFATAAPSTVRLYYDGRLIQTTAHGGTACPAK